MSSRAIVLVLTGLFWAGLLFYGQLPFTNEYTSADAMAAPFFLWLLTVPVSFLFVLPFLWRRTPAWEAKAAMGGLAATNLGVWVHAIAFASGIPHSSFAGFSTFLLLLQEAALLALFVAFVSWLRRPRAAT